MPSSYIAPAEHIKMAEVFGPTDIRRATYIEHEWVWEVSNNSRSADGYLAFYLEYKHDKWQQQDEMFFEYVPNKGFVHNKGMMGIIGGSDASRKFAEFAEGNISGRLAVVTLEPGLRVNLNASLTIPGPMFSLAAKEWWEKNNDAAFHLTIKIFQLPSPDSLCEAGVELVEHRYPKIWEVDNRGW